jgi:hypothetical protein
MVQRLSGKTPSGKKLNDKTLSGKTLAKRAAAGFVAAVIGTYVTRILVRIAEIWPIFHGKSFGPLVELLSQDTPLMLKACLAAGVIFGIFFMLAPRSLMLSVIGAVLLMNALVLGGRIYMAGGLQYAMQPGAVPYEAFVRATLRALVILVIYRLLRPLFERLEAAEA